MKLDKNTKKDLIKLWETNKISLEGSILKVIESEDDPEFDQYLQSAIERDKETRRKRLDITKQVQTQNKELLQWKQENEEIQKELKESLQETERSMVESEKLRGLAEKAKLEAELARDEAENAKKSAESNLELIQKRKQFELMGIIIKVSMGIIIGIGLVSTVIYIIALLNGIDTSVIGSWFTNIIGILLTNSFSIVGTIIGVKYASEKDEK